MDPILREEAMAHGLDPLTHPEKELRKLVEEQKDMRRAVHMPQQPDVDAGEAEEVVLPGAVGEQKSK